MIRTIIKKIFFSRPKNKSVFIFELNFILGSGLIERNVFKKGIKVFFYFRNTLLKIGQAK